MARSSQTAAMQKEKSRRHVKNNKEKVEEEARRQVFKMNHLEEDSPLHVKIKSKRYKRNRLGTV